MPGGKKPGDASAVQPTELKSGFALFFLQAGSEKQLAPAVLVPLFRSMHKPMYLDENPAGSNDLQFELVPTRQTLQIRCRRLGIFDINHYDVEIHAEAWLQGKPYARFPL